MSARTQYIAILSTIVFVLSTNTYACGKERWPVKVGTDKDVSLVSMDITDTNIAKLSEIGAPSNPDIRRDTRYQPVETSQYRISGHLIVIKREADEDYHLVIQDNKKRTMIVEVPATRCAKGSRYLKEIKQVRSDLYKRYHLTGKKKLKPNAEVTVTGIGFFDKIHGQEGVAPNGIELHPLLSIEFK